ncbi:hypothetical protein [Methanosarcina sp.]
MTKMFEKEETFTEKTEDVLKLIMMMISVILGVALVMSRAVM